MNLSGFSLLHLTGFGAPVEDANGSVLDLYSMESTCGMVQPVGVDLVGLKASCR